MNPAKVPLQSEQVNYTQVNILFPSSEVELPSAEKYKEFPLEAQKAILTGFHREQTERHTWLRNQQRNEHEINMLVQKQFFTWRLVGTIVGGVLAITTIGLGALLVTKGASATGVTMLVTAGAALIGSAVYGQRVNTGKKPKPKAEQAPSTEVKRV